MAQIEDQWALEVDGQAAPLDTDTVSKRFERLKKRLADLARQQGLVD